MAQCRVSMKCNHHGDFPSYVQQSRPQHPQWTFTSSAPVVGHSPSIPVATPQRSTQVAIPVYQRTTKPYAPVATNTPPSTSATTQRTIEYPIHPVFIERWSPRSFIPKPISEPTILSLFEAARWAPSGFNKQPWRFIYCLRQSPEWSKWMDVVVPQNASWAQHSSALILVTSDKANPTATFDTGAACANLYTQATFLGLATHPIGGFDRQKARDVAKVPETYNIEAMIVVGYRGEPERLPKELQEREQPSTRHSVSEIANAIEFHTDKTAGVRN